MIRDLPNTLSIGSYCHCGKCLKELPKGQSPQSFSALEVGFTREGLQIWCKRHQVNVAHIDFEGHCHPANLTALPVANPLPPFRPDEMEKLLRSVSVVLAVVNGAIGEKRIEGGDQNPKGWRDLLFSAMTQVKAFLKDGA